MKTEQECRSLIDQQLKNAGWLFNTKNRNVFQESPKHRIERKKLGRLRPDYILYSNDYPLAIIEAKRENGDFLEAKDKGFEKANKISCPIVYVSDSNHTEAYQIYEDKSLYRNRNKVSYFLREAELVQHKAQAVVEDKILINTEQELIKVFEMADNVLRTAGKEQGMPRLLEFSNVVFLKMLFDIDTKKGQTPQFSWQDMTNKNGTTLVNFFNHIIEEYNSRYQNILEPSTVEGEVLKDLIRLVDNMGNLDSIDFDIKGEAFEYFLKAYQDKHSDLAQYFTPRHIVRFVLFLAKPKIGQKIYDPFCGTGGFLTEAYKHIKRTSKLDKSKKKQLKENTVYGQDNSGSSRIARMNMILVGDGHCNIEKKDTLRDEPKDIYDLVITNIPFNLKPRPFENNKSCINFCLKSLNKNGRAYVIVPYSIMESSYDNFREQLEPYLEAYIKLPHYTFKPYTSASSFIIVLNKNKRESDSYKYVEIEHDGFSKDDLREPVVENDIEKFRKGEINFSEITFFGKRENNYTCREGTPLKEYLIDNNDRTILLQDDEKYCEPQVNADNTIITRRSRLGRNIRGESKKIDKKRRFSYFYAAHTERIICYCR